MFSLDTKGCKSKIVLGGFKIQAPLFTFVVPTYNRLFSLKETLQSILFQTTDIDYEVVIVDNDSENFPALIELIKSINDSRLILIVNNENYGQIVNWNIGISYAKSDWVILLHDDDRINPNYLNCVNDAIKENPNISGLAPLFDDIILDSTSSIKYMFNFKNRLFKFKKKCIRLKKNDFYFENGYYAPIAAVYKRELVLALNGFNPDLYPISDMDFHYRYVSKFNYYIMPKVLAYRGVGFNESLNAECQIGTIEKGFVLRKEIENDIGFSLGSWWIQSVIWYKIRQNYKIKAAYISKIELDDTFDNLIFKKIYLIVYRLYLIKIFLRRN